MDPSKAPQGWTASQLVAFGVLYGSLVTFIVTSYWSQKTDGLSSRVESVSEFVRSSYVRDVTERDLTIDALRGMVSGLDAYSQFYASQAELDHLGRETSGRYLGLGVVFATPVSDYRVLFAVSGSPGERAGLQPGDRILSIDDTDLAQTEPGELQRIVGQRPARELHLRVQGLDSAARDVRLTPEELVDPTVRHARMLDESRGIGYLAITGFSRQTPGEFDAALRAWLGAEPRWSDASPLRGLIVDLRGNLGGVLASAVALANRFIDRGLIVSREGRAGREEHTAQEEAATLVGLPLVILQDIDSASASEVLAGALQDHRKAVLVGMPSFGKGVVQSIRQFEDAAVRLTTAYYYTPAKRNLERSVENAWETGLLPDLQIALDKEEQQAVRAFLQRYSPPPAALGAIRAWEARESRRLLPQHPPDAQLEAALLLFEGRRPGTWGSTP